MGNPIREKAIKGLEAGDSFVYTRTFSKEESMAFGDLTNDYNPVHYDRRWTDGKGFRDLICHGLLIGGMICEFGGQVGWLATGMNFKFLHPVYFNDTILCRVTGRLPLEKEKQILSRMLSEGDSSNKLAQKIYNPNIN